MDVDEVYSEFNQLARDHQKLKDLQKSIKLQTEDIRTKITDGATAGDSIRNLVLLVHGYDPELEAKYRTLEERLKGKQGEFVLIRFYDRERGIEAEQRLGRYDGSIRIGILAGETLRLTRPEAGLFATSQTITLPINRYAYGTWRTGVYAATLEDTLSHGEFFRYSAVYNRDGCNATPPDLCDYLDEPYSKEMFIGNEAVRAELALGRNQDLFQRALIALDESKEGQAGAQ
jgi:hypothetical protein